MKYEVKEIKDKPSVDISHQLREMITSGELRPGDTLPAERKLAEKFGVGRLIVRDAIKKLEFYGIVRTLPQSGTVGKGKGLLALEGILIDVLDLEETDFASIVETRNLLEIKSAGLAATKRTEEDILSIKSALKAHEDKINEGSPAEEEDFQLHLQIAEVSGNSMLKLLMRIITPDILKNFTAIHPDRAARNKDILREHRDIVDQIVGQNAKEAKNAMRRHLRARAVAGEEES